MENYPPVIRRIIYLLLLLLVMQRVESASLGGDITVDTTLTLNGSAYVVSQDLVVAENATLTIQPGVKLHFKAGVALQVKGSLQAKGNSHGRIVFSKIPTNLSVNVDDLNVTAPYNDGIRLSGGKNYRVGRLEIFVRGQWGTVCRDSFDIKDAQVACRQLGFLGAKRFYTHGGGTGPTWLDEVDCKGTEKSLLLCKHPGIGVENCDHRRDIGIECHSLAKLLSSKVFWKGVDFSSSKKTSSLQYVDVSQAYEAIKGNNFLPTLDHVTVKSSVYGVTSDNISSPLTISDSSIKDNRFAGIRIKGRSKTIKIENTAVHNTTSGDGLSYSEVMPDPADFCTLDVNAITFPIFLQAFGKARMNVECAKIIRTQPGRHLAVHYQSMTGEKFELHVHDGNTKNDTEVTLVNQWTGVNQAVTPSSSSGHELYIRFRFSAGSQDAKLKFLITDFQDVSSIEISNCTFNDNRGRGIILKDFTGKTTISTTTVYRNKGEGMTAERISGTITATDTHFVNNSANGLGILDSSFLSCNLHGLSAKGNVYNGLYLRRTAFKSNVSDSTFTKNVHNGFAISNGAGEIEFRNVTAVLNTHSGIKIYDGKVSSDYRFSNLSNNKEDGCCISNQAGAHQFFNCTAKSNSRHGISLFDVRSPHWNAPPRHQFKSFDLEESTITDNTQYGVKLGPECQYWSESAVNVTMAITKNQIMRNNKGGIFLSPDSCTWSSSSLRPRRVETIVRNNNFEENKVNAFYIFCTGFLGLQAVFESNTFLNNTDKVITLIDNNNCGANYNSNPVNVKIDKNIFTKNRAENILYIDYSSFPETRSAIMTNNTFEDNEVLTKDLFPAFFRRSTTRAVIVLKEGSFTLRENILENSGFTFQLSTLRHDHRRGVDAKFNWWGTTKECEIVDRIFDFQRRVQLSPVDFFPFLLLANKTSAISISIPRPSCFLRGASIGGVVDRPIALSSADSPYDVRDDIVILSNGSLIIPKNVTLQFPSRSAMVVQGTLHADGTENEKVRFVKKQHQKGFRLGRGPGPWEGRVEFLVNDTWWPMCLPYGRSFTNEGRIICQQRDLYYYQYRAYSPSSQEPGFVHNVVCDGNINSDIMNCSANTWSYGPSCRGYTVRVYCQQYNWAGLHLAMSNHKSLLHHLEIHDAGYAYRSDIQIPGAAFKVDLYHHNISNVLINNSVGIGVQVVYQSLFHNQSLMPHSIISHTKSHGVLSRSPSLTLTDANVTRNDVNGFVYESTWDKLNTFTAVMASPDVYKTFHACSENKTLLLANRVFHFTLERLESSPTLRCQHIMETEPGYKLVIQDLYYASSYRYSHFLHVYDGTNTSVGSPWKIESLPWQDRPIFNSTKSSVVFDLYKRYSMNLAINFLVYTVKESEQLHYLGGEINIARSKITNSLKGGILIGGNLLKSVTITDTGITNSKEFGIKLAPRGIEAVKITSINLEQNKQGIVINPMHLGSKEFSIENCAINASLLQGMYIHSDIKSTIRIINSSITNSGDRGLYIQGQYRGMYLSLFVTGSTFAWNKKGAIWCYNNYRNEPVTLQFESNIFFRNQGPTVEILAATDMTTWVLLNNTFNENQGFSVIALGTASLSGSQYRPAVVVSGNKFLTNQCPEKAVIDIRREANSFIIKDNSFEYNSGRCVLLEGTAAYVPISIVDNVFNDNDCGSKSLIEALRLDQHAKFMNNTLTQNRAGSVFLLQVVHGHRPSFQNKELTFQNNTLSRNIPHIATQSLVSEDSCAVVISGILYHKETEFRLNKVNNSKYLRELCVRVPAISSRDVVNVSHNWWGTAIGSEVRDRISDFDDNYDFAIADDWPFLLSDDDPTLTAVEQHDFKQHGSVLSGRLFESMTLKASHSPYSVTSDLAVLDNVTLTIEAGVTVKVSPGMSILVAGALRAHGTSTKPVTFTVKEPAGSNKDPDLPVRLVDGDFPWEGRAEVFHEKSWKPVSASNNMLAWNTTEVVCRQLGYGPPVVVKGNAKGLNRNLNGTWLMEFRCSGNETFLHECPKKQRAFNYSTTLAEVKCQGVPWGSIRFISSREVNASQTQSVLDNVEFSHCGNRHGMAVPAIEAVTNTPWMDSIAIRNCTSGGLRIHFPGTDVHLNNSTFVNIGGTGISFVQTRRSIVVKSSESSRNQRGIAFEEPRAENVPQVYYGRVFLCNKERVANVKNQTLLYFDIPRLQNTMPQVECEKVLTVPKGQGIKLTLSYFKGSQRLMVYDSSHTSNLIVDRSNKDITALVHKELFIPRDTILLKWNGDVNSKVVIQVEDINISYTPCTFEIGLCGWQTFTNMSINGLQVTRTWRIARHTWPDAPNDYSYFYSNGKRLLIGNDRWPTVDGRAAIISPRITKLSQLCSIVFFYRVVKQGRAGLSLYIQTGTYPNIEQRLIWQAKNVEVPSWRKVVVELPNDINEYRLLFEGEYNKTTNYWTRNFVTIDNIELRSCSHKGEHRISNSVFSDNIHQAISYTSVADGSDARPRFTTERCKITDTPASPSNMPQKAAISLDIQDNNYTLANNFIFGNRLGGIQAHLGRSDGTSLPRSLIYGNTFSSNANGTILVEERKELNRNYSFVKIVDNAFGSNMGQGSTIKLSGVQSEILNNFFYNNSGLHSIEYDFSSALFKEQKCELNTFYLNKGLGQNYGVTVKSNGPMEYHRNNLKNPSNLYEFSSTTQAVSDPIEAARNWWGVGIDSSVGLRIYEKEDDYSLASVEFKPFKKLPPRNILSIGCPADWLNVESTCYVFRGGSRTLKEAKDYCQYYGGHVASTSIPDDMEFINMAIQASRPDGKQTVPIWVTTEADLEEENGGEEISPRCTVMTQNRIQKVVPCTSLYPFVCTRTAVIRCPNGCFHNGDCVGATCFCYRGWTGHDCSQFHCNDVHNCSGNGQCVGPNVCKCTPGFIGRGCTYSYCTKYHRCSTCSRESACGWCDSSQQCMPGTSVGPYAKQCPDWFYYTCYTVGSVNHCSNKIQRVDCTNRQCNGTQETTTSESCQKCEDLEKCYNYVEQGKCRAWNETRCPHGLVQVDYKDPNRINNTLIRSNVKVIDPNTTIIYSCPVILPGQDFETSVFVVPRGLEIKVGDVLSSAQAGGVMHKVNVTTTTGPYMILIGTPSKIEDVIQYADFSQKVSAVELEDETTVDEEPNLDDLYGLMDGNIQLNDTDLHVIPADTSVFKCVGHIYKVDDDLVSSQFLVISKDHAINVRPGDVVVSAQSHGFIEKVVRINQTSDMVFMETELERCTENSTWTTKFKPRLQGSTSDDDVICSGGDNSYGLIITEPDGEQEQISVNDSIIGRNSNPFIAKVVEAHVIEDLLLIEVLAVKSVLNGTAVAIVRLDQLHKEHRRYKRDVDKERITFSKSHQAENKLQLGKGYINVQQTFKIYADFIVSMGVFTDRDEDGDLIITDALFGLEMVGEVIYNVDVQIGVEGNREYYKRDFDILNPRQIGRTFCVPITGVCIPCAFFLQAKAEAVVKAVLKAYLPLSLRTSVRLGMGGFCTRRGGCNRINPLFSFNRRLDKGNVKIEAEIAADALLIPKLTFRLPTVPRALRSLLNKFNNLWKKVFKEFLGYNPGESSSTGDFSILRLSAELPFGIKSAVKPCSDKCIKKSERKPNELALSFGFSEIVGRLAIGFGEKNYELAALSRKIYGGAWEKSFCLACGNSKACGCPTTPPPTTTELTTTERTTTERTTTEKTTAATTEVTTGTATTVGTTEATTGTATTVGTTELTTGTGSTLGSTEPTTVTGTTKATTPPTGSTTPHTGTTATPTPTTSGTTPPPTTPPPCECPDGEQGIVDENGNCDCPPECEKGQKPVIVNNRYECPDHPPCGKPPNCVVERKGPDCSQPDVQPCSAGCSGNGAAVATADCGSRCECSIRWTGTCCEERRPWRNWGDPHLETLDGIEYDYYGIGEFWGCKSLFNDFGMQFRYFAYQRASLTGGVALKAGQSVLSIMTVNTSDPQEFPKLRIDGRLVNLTAYVGQKMKLNNGTVVMDIQKTFSSQSDETGIVLISLQYESGLTVTTDIRHSLVMRRQYLNVLFTPTAAFKGHTEGLCGVMDNDPSNDLKGPDGEQYDDPIQFADSWRITAVHNNSGLQGTWSWNSSNFHSDDVMDSSYNDPNFVPVYSLDGISDAIISKATAACSSLGLSDAMLKSCIYDVAVTNDTSLSDQETLKQDCPNQCSGKGRCVNATCQCMIGWSGDSCEVGNCTDCSAEHGKCVKGFCECEDGWEGVTCEQKATCYNVNNCTTPTNGICQRTDQCRCHDGYIGRDCSIIPTCSNVSDCSGRGICVDYDVCKCQKEWTGKDCTQFSCGSLDHCSGHGRCVNLYKCDCNPGWTGASCAVPDCTGVNQCSGQGECISSDTCRCYPGFQGVNCSDVADCANLGNCSGNGVCMQEKQGGDLTCRCYAGFSGTNCSLASCLSVNNCSGHGLCLEADFCRCDVGYSGPDCSNVSCEGVNYCSGHGVCTGYDTCVCDLLWHGPACSEADCSSLNHCSNKGDCILPNTCECYPGYDGAACNTTAKPNLHSPVFAAAFYNASVLENSPLGTKILQVQASDADLGRNGQLLFSLDDINDVSPSFTIDSISGEIFTSSALDYESSSPHLYKLKIVASDNGTPRKSSFVFMYINIVDVNDNCPVFNSFHTKWFNISQHTHPGTLLTVVSATDQDSGFNGVVKYGLSFASSLDGAFKVGEENGELTVVGELSAKEYRLLIIARDLGTPSCSRQTDVTVNVFAESAVTETPSEISTATIKENSTTGVSTVVNTNEIPVSVPTKSWYKHPMTIMGMTIGGFVVLCLVLLALLFVLSRKLKRKNKVMHSPLIRGSRLAVVTGSAESSRPSTPDLGVIEDLEMEHLERVLRGIKTTEAFEMKRMHHLDF
ncbi:uncharacterized protein LOC144628871 isoform X1 [Oculina patagonica]